MEFSKKEDAIFNMMSKIMDISLKEYDKQNTLYDDILLTGKNLYLECNTSTGYRNGGFKGSRNCLNEVNESDITEEKNDDADYIEGYNGVSEPLNVGHTNYTLDVNVTYSKGWDGNDYNYSDGGLDFEFNASDAGMHTNIKRVNVTVSEPSGDIISSVSYYSANIGHIKINSIQW
jgi:hypothetical protein